MKLITIGSDPELLLVADEGKTTEKIISAIGFGMGGTKKKPKDISQGFFMQEDNVLLEFNTPPVSNKKDFLWAIKEGQELVKRQLPLGYGVKVQTSHYFDEDQLRHPKAKEFGCDPDLNAWIAAFNSPPNTDTNLRTTGGHVYIGYDISTEKEVKEATDIKIAKAMDIFAAVPSIFLDRDAMRRELYGKAGAYRHKPFGLEYRTLSSFWIANDKFIEWVYDAVIKSLEFVESGAVEALTETDQALIESAVNESNSVCAEVIMDKFKVKLP